MKNQKMKLSFPSLSSSDQGSGEYFFIENNGKKEKVTYHEYDKIYSIPGLYEELFYDKLECCSPAVVGGLINKYYQKNDLDTSDLNILDVGAGNGIMGEELQNIGVNSITGLDIIEEAEASAMRDRPDVYEKYYTADLLDLSDSEEKALTNAEFNGITIVAALGFDDIPTTAFAVGYNYISSPGLCAFNIKDDFINEKDSTGFSKLINSMVDENLLDIKEKHYYQHRLCQDGTPLNYYAIVAEKKEDIPDQMIEQFV